MSFVAEEQQDSFTQLSIAGVQDVQHLLQLLLLSLWSMAWQAAKGSMHTFCHADCGASALWRCLVLCQYACYMQHSCKGASTTASAN